MKRIIDTAKIAPFIHDIEQGCFMLGYVNDADDMDDVEYYAQRIRSAVDDLKSVVQKSKVWEGES